MNGIDRGLNGAHESVTTPRAVDGAALFPIAMLLAITVLQSNGFFPRLSLIADWLPAACACLFGVTFLPLVFMASRYAALLEGKATRSSMLILSIAGAFLCWRGISQSNVPVILIAYVCLSLPRAFANCLALIRLARNDNASTFMTVALAMAGAYAFVALGGPAVVENSVPYLALTPLALTMSYVLVPRSASARPVAPLELATVNPDSFPESKGKLMSCIAVSEGVFGLSSTIFGDTSTSSPLLGALYPLAIALVVLGLLQRAYGAGRLVWIWTIGVTGVVSVSFALRDALAPTLWMPLDVLPLATDGLGWIVPAVAGALIGATCARLSHCVD